MTVMEREATEAMGEVELVCGWWEVETIYGMSVCKTTARFGLCRMTDC